MTFERGESSTTRENAAVRFMLILLSVASILLASVLDSDSVGTDSTAGVKQVTLYPAPAMFLTTSTASSLMRGETKTMTDLAGSTAAAMVSTA